MSTEEWVRLVWSLWIEHWPYAGSQWDRAGMLAEKAHIEAVTGWTWSPPYSYDNPPVNTMPSQTL